MVGMKTCSRCGKEKDLSQFPENRNVCKECKNKREREKYKANPEPRRKNAKAWAKANPEKNYTKKRAWYVQNTYGITLDEYNALKESCQFCAICGLPDPTDLDHDAETKQLRGFLCGNHNRALGLFQHDPALLRAAANYLDGYGSDQI